MICSNEANVPNIERTKRDGYQRKSIRTEILTSDLRTTGQ